MKNNYPERKMPGVLLAAAAAVMLLAIMIIPGSPAFAAKNATNYEPRSGPHWAELDDGTIYWEAYITFHDNAVDGEGFHHIFNAGAAQNDLKGITYDQASNTLTLENFKYPLGDLYTKDMGDDFTIKVIGSCEINTLEIGGNSYQGKQGVPYYWGGSLNLEGPGTLTIRNSTADADNPWGFILWGEGSESLLKISEHVSLKVTGYNSEAAIMIIRSAGFYSDEAITVGGKPLHQVYSKYTVEGFANEAEPTLKDYWVKSSEVILKGDGKAAIDDAKVEIAEQYLEYTGNVLTPVIKSIDGQTLKEGSDYTVTYSPGSPTNTGGYTGTIQGKGKYTGRTKFTYSIIPAAVAEASVSGITSKAYTGKEITQAPVVKVGSRTLQSGTDYALSYKNNKKVGTATVTITGKGNYCDTISKTFKITKGKNPLSVKGKTATVKYKALKKKAQKLKVSKVLKFSKKGKGKVTYKKKSGDKKITIAKKGGKVTVKKGLKKGTYKITVQVAAAGNASYKSLKKTVTFKIKVK